MFVFLVTTFNQQPVFNSENQTQSFIRKHTKIVVSKVLGRGEPADYFTSVTSVYFTGVCQKGNNFNREYKRV